MENNPHPIKNRLLAALPHDEYTRLQPHLESVQLLYPVRIVAEVVVLREGQRALLSGGR